MAKINISFNGADYLIDESSFIAATTDLQSHLSATMSGSGTTVSFGEISYNIDSTKLTTARNNFTSYLGTISGSGAKVVVNGVEYAINSTKIASALSELENTLSELESGGDSTIPTDLTGYTVTVPVGWTAIAGYGQYNLRGHFSINGLDMDEFATSDIKNFCVGYLALFGALGTMENRVWCGNSSSSIKDTMVNASNSYSIILDISGGTDVTNQSLIQWLVDNNATFEKVEEEVNLISFTIGTIGTYQAESGMTWSEWIDSEYNTRNFIESYLTGTPSYGSVAITNVTMEDEIIDGYTYNTATIPNYEGGTN